MAIGARWSSAKCAIVSSRAVSKSLSVPPFRVDNFVVVARTSGFHEATVRSVPPYATRSPGRILSTSCVGVGHDEDADGIDDGCDCMSTPFV